MREPREAFGRESEDEQEQRVVNLELLQAVTMLREDDLTKPRETAETKGELSREDVQMTSLQGMQDLHPSDGRRVVDSWSA